MSILSGDIGGTKTRLAIFDIDDLAVPILEKSYPSAGYSSLQDISADFLSLYGRPVSDAAFGIAGPITGRRCKTTNLPWEIDAGELEQKLGIDSVHLINDLEATAYGIASLNKEDIHTLQQGTQVIMGNCAVIAAGTGLGQAGMFWDGSRHIPFATEGGHCDFAPGSDLEMELLSKLKRDGHNVCWEQIVSGPGLVSIYRFLLDRRRLEHPAWLDIAPDSGDAASTITALATNREDPVGAEALEIFSRLYGAEAGNLALKIMSIGGIYLGGGIAPKILDWLKRPHFLEAFCNKGKMQGLMKSIPVHVILNDRAALLGASAYLGRYILPEK